MNSPEPQGHDSRPWTLLLGKNRKKFPLVHFDLLSASGLKKTSLEQKKGLWQVI